MPTATIRHDSPVVMAFLKAPRPGTVKTRLARDIGVIRATRLYRRLAERQLEVVPPEFVLEVHYAPRSAGSEMRAWLGDRLTYRAQSGGDLGRRLAQAFARAFSRGATRVLAIGADCPSLDARCLRAAARHLRRTDVVIGPARDGGYYLIGLRRPEPRLFSDIAWSSDAVLRQTRQRAAQAGLSVVLMKEMEDVDDVHSLQRVRVRASRGHRLGSRTRAG
jgi:hypothetical protein